MKSYNLQSVYANLDKMLITAQQEYEETIEKYIEFAENYANAVMEYRKLKAEKTKEYKQAGEPVTVISNYVQGDTAEAKRNMIIAESQKKHIEKMIEAYNNRINMLKFIGKKTENVIK